MNMLVDSLMITQEDIQKIVEAQRDIFITKEDLEGAKDEILADFSNLQTAVDAYAKKADTYFQEMLLLARKVDRHEKWLHQLAEKLGVKLEY